MKKYLSFLVLMLTVLSHSPLANAGTPLDNTLEPQTDDKSNVFQDMGVVQRKAMKKRGRFLLSTYYSLEFSDGPYTNSSIHVNPGYAISDFFEVYVSFAPTYVTSARSLVNTVYAGTNGTYYITAQKPKQEYGVELLWSPLYGKDSFGVSSIVRSDTFLKLGLTQVKYDSTNGTSIKLGIGKTFFLGQYVGLRLCIDYDYVETIVNNTKAFNSQLLTELGAVVYF